MSAQPADAGAVRITLPRTIRAIRAALPEDRRAQFAADLEDTDAGGLVTVVDKRWTRAVVWSSPETMAQLREYQAGTLRTVPAKDVLGDRWPDRPATAWSSGSGQPAALARWMRSVMISS